jgi:hypothetical protein
MQFGNPPSSKVAASGLKAAHQDNDRRLGQEWVAINVATTQNARNNLPLTKRNGPEGRLTSRPKVRVNGQGQ